MGRGVAEKPSGKLFNKTPALRQVGNDSAGNQVTSLPFVCDSSFHSNSDRLNKT